MYSLGVAKRTEWSAKDLLSSDVDHLVRRLSPTESHPKIFGTLRTVTAELALGPFRVKVHDQPPSNAATNTYVEELPAHFQRDNPLHVCALVVPMETLWATGTTLADAQRALRDLMGASPCDVILATKFDEVLRKRENRATPTTCLGLAKEIDAASDVWDEALQWAEAYRAQVVSPLLGNGVTVVPVDFHSKGGYSSEAFEVNVRRNDAASVERVSAKTTAALKAVLDVVHRRLGLVSVLVSSER